jgi:hypothetical protein
MRATTCTTFVSLVANASARRVAAVPVVAFVLQLILAVILIWLGGGHPVAATLLRIALTAPGLCLCTTTLFLLLLSSAIAPCRGWTTRRARVRIHRPAFAAVDAACEFVNEGGIVFAQASSADRSFGITRDSLLGETIAGATLGDVFTPNHSW